MLCVSLCGQTIQGNTTLTGQLCVSRYKHLYLYFSGTQQICDGSKTVRMLIVVHYIPLILLQNVQEVQLPFAESLSVRHLIIV